MKRLVKKKMNKTAALFSNFNGDLDSFVLPSGDVICFCYRLINNGTTPMFQVYQEGLYNISSFYDGPDYDKAERMYKDLLTAFEGIKTTEKFDNYRMKDTIDYLKSKDDKDSEYRLKVKEMLYGMDRTEEF